MKFDKDLFVLVTLFILPSFMFYYVCNDLIFTLILLLVGLLAGIYIYFKMWKTYKVKIAKFNESINFINKYIITLSSVPSNIEAFNSCNELLSNETHTKLKNLNLVEEKLLFLEKEYNLQLYEVFLAIQNEYFDKGGNILSYSSSFLAETRRIQSHENDLYKKRKNGFFEFVFMWLFSFLVPLIAKIALKGFYESFTSNYLFTILIFIGFLMFYISSIIYFISNSNLRFVRRGKYEK